MPWCPDFWPYDDYYVLAMRRYRKLDLEAMTEDQRRQHAAILEAVGVPVECKFGLSADGTVVLLRGGCNFQG